MDNPRKDSDITSLPGRLPRSSDSVSSDLSSVLTARTNLTNGQLLATITAKIRGRCQASLVFDSNEVPTSLRCHGINLTYAEFDHILSSVVPGEKREKQRFWLFTIKPVAILGVAFAVWLIAFIMVIVVFLDAPKASALPIRLTVFIFPLVFVIFGYSLRWKRRQKQTELAMKMFTKCTELNRDLYCKDKPLILTSARTERNVFHKQITSFMENIPNHESAGMTTSLDPENNETASAMSQYTLSEQLCTQLSAQYGQRLFLNLIPKVKDTCHVHNYQCLCQFVEDFIEDYLQRLRKCREEELPDDVFNKYVNCTLRKNSMKTVQELLIHPDGR